MSGRPNTQETIALSFEILKRIPRTHKVTASELRQQLSDAGFERDIRSIQRNLEMLSEHFDIERDASSKPYGYSWLKSSKGLSLNNLSAQESLLLGLAEAYLCHLLPANLMSSLEPFFSEARKKLIPTNEQSKEREWLEKVRVVGESFSLLPPRIDSTVFQNVSEALFQNRFLKLSYYNSKREDRSALVMPLGIAQQGQRFYLVCRFDGYENERSVAIHRIKSASISSFTFERPKGFKLSQYDADGRFGFGEGQLCDLTFCISKSAGYHLLETPLSENQHIEEQIEHLIVSATVIQSKQLERWLNGFEDQVWNIEIKEKE